MNKVELIGRLTKDAELKESGENKYTRLNVAVNRRFKNEDGEYDADFISCVAWNKTAELIVEHFKKGSEIGIEGRIQTGSYEKENGDKVYTTDVIVENITFIGSKKEGRPAPEYTGEIATENDKKEEDPFLNQMSYAGVAIDESDLPF